MVTRSVGGKDKRFFESESASVYNGQRWAAILKNVSFKAIQSHNFLEKNRLKRYNFVCQKFFHR